MSDSNPKVITIENKIYGKIDWTLPEDLVAKISRLAKTDAEQEEAFAFLGATAAKLFGTVMYCFQFGALPDLDAILLKFASQFEPASPPPTTH